MIYSHSKMQTILKDIHSYFLNYLCKLKPATTSKALLIGSAVHEGIDKGDSDLSEYFLKNGSFSQRHAFSYEQALSEAMVEAYLRESETIIGEIVGDAKILETHNEIKLEAPMKNSDNSFLGIVDLLLKTDKGWIVIDYKTTSMTPNYDDYIEQLYRYCFLLNRIYPEIPIYKIAIISIRKSQIRQRGKESIEEFKMRLTLDYKEKGTEYITHHTFDLEKDEHIFSNDILEGFYENMENLLLLCDSLVNIKKFPIIYSEAISVYGHSPFFNLIYLNKEKAQNDLLVNDRWWNDDLEVIEDARPLISIDWVVIELREREVLDVVIRLYSQFCNIIDNDLKNYDEKKFQKEYLVDIDLLRNYKKVFEVENLKKNKKI